MRRPSPAALACAAPLAAALLAACRGAAPPPPPVQAPPPVVTAAASSSAAPSALTPAQIAARATSAVVAIRSPRSLGTGFVVKKDGWIATNLHVIVGSGELVVATADKREFPVLEVLAFDERRDVALIRIDAKDMGVVTLGDSDTVHAGDSVVAIGHPLGLVDTVSNGLVSAVRTLDPDLTLLQISAPIAPGSSGGPLFSDKGEVIGVATAIVNQGQNLNFGVPIRYLKALLDDTHPVPLAAFAQATSRPPSDLPVITRDVPHHDLAFLAGCTDADLQRSLRIVEEAIEVGAPVYNQHHFAACYHIYEGAALDLEKKVPASCPGPRKAMRDGRARAAKLADPSAQAWAMRDAFDGLTEVIMKKLGSPRP